MIFKLLIASALTASIAQAAQTAAPTLKMSSQQKLQLAAPLVATNKLSGSPSAMKDLKSSVQTKMGQDGNGGGGIFKDGITK